MHKKYGNQSIVNAINASEDFVLIKGLKSKLLWANASFLKYYGMSEEELFNIIDADTSDPDDTLQYIKDDNYVFKNKKSLFIESEPITNSLGETQYFETKKYPIFNEENEVNEIVIVSRKIEDDELIEASKEERTSRKNFLYFQKKFISQIKSPILFLDAQNRVISASDVFCEIFNSKATDVVGLFAKDFITRGEYPEQDESIETDKAKIEINGVEVKGFMTITPWYFEHNQSGGHLLFFSDRSKEIALQSELEQERKRSILSDRHKSLGELSAGVGHEINNPLSIILGTLEKVDLLYKEEVPESIKADLQIMERNAKRIGSIVKGLKNLSRDASKDDLETVNILGVINDALSLCEGRANNMGIKIIRNTDLNFKVSCRPAEIAQVIYNLLSNSIDEISAHTDPWIQITTKNLDGKNIICLMDSGKGIPQEVSAKMFDPFFTTKKAGQGTGLGLGISKQIMIQHEGDLILKTKSKNTNFNILFKEIS